VDAVSRARLPRCELADLAMMRRITTFLSYANVSGVFRALPYFAAGATLRQVTER
jgi:hypothetical protein